MNNPLVFSDLKPKDYSDYIKDVEKRCSSLNRKHYYRYPLEGDHAFVWTKRNDRRYRLQLSFLDHDGVRRYCPFVEADDFLINRYIDYLHNFVQAFIEYCLWEYPTVWG
jgi:hypothetical protein